MKHFKNIITRGLPKTGQTTSYQAGDDGDSEAGWWFRRLVATNRTRFKVLTLAGDDVVIDRATALMWSADAAAAGGNNSNLITWPDAITYAEGLTFAGFSDWHLPNFLELASIVNQESIPPKIYMGFFSNVMSETWTSTTAMPVTTKAYAVDFGWGDIYPAFKTVELLILCVRRLK